MKTRGRLRHQEGKQQSPNSPRGGHRWAEGGEAVPRGRSRRQSARPEQGPWGRAAPGTSEEQRGARVAGAEWRRGTEGQGEGGEGPGAARVGPCGPRGGRGVLSHGSSGGL